ncbi:MAG: UDP-N-acetylmuramate dehydrogenase [Prolixibacteraceae bacterium]|nr:UDP-N-acetylmuramate dehydrogenase [Prolixibacteraceae bacterium]MBN2648342.1 UDP-N-acetylmuramate dehydrogenase [Prolixibacteraceae bacterium]
MIRLLENYNLAAYNTFGIAAKTKSFFEFTEADELVYFLQEHSLPEHFFILGGGSNLLLKNDFEGLVIYPNVPGVGEIDEDRNHIYIEAGAGVEWDELVRLSVVYQLGGLENLSLIPGKVGAAPVQNVGAYGAEAKDKIHLVRAVELATGQKVEFSNHECQFGYRNSIFKNELKNKVVITSVVFKLDKFPEFNLAYGSLNDEVAKNGEVALQNVRDAVIRIRQSKLPDPLEIGNAGSFFKNPVVPDELAANLKSKYPDMPSYPSGFDGETKLAAGWLIEQCGWKGFREGHVGVHKDQALVLVNYGGASGAELVALADKIQQSVYKKFAVKLQPEVNIVG